MFLDSILSDIFQPFAASTKGGTRTLTPSQEADFESAASTIPPLWQVIGFYRIFWRRRQVGDGRLADFVLIFAIIY